MSESSGPASPSVGVGAELLRERLKEHTGPDGFVPFDRFMDVALYGEGVGFYAREEPPFGRKGAFYTAAHASPLFGRTIAERVRQVARSVPDGAPFRVVDAGAGDGTLGEALVGGLSEDRELVPRLEYVLVERSVALSVRALDRVSGAARSSGIPVRALGSVAADGPFVGVVVANELLDAQPARRLLWDGTAWNECGVRWNGEVFAPATVPSTRPVPGPALPPNPAPGTVVEFSPMAEAFVREVADHLRDGLFLVLDYGMEEPELLAAHPSGTLAAVRQHRVVADPLADPGSSDLSVFVNFTRLRRVAARAGLSELSYRRQAEALGAWGFPRVFDRAVSAAGSPEAEVRLRLGAKNLLFGFERFHALEWSPGPAGNVPVGTT